MSEKTYLEALQEALREQESITASARAIPAVEIIDGETFREGRFRFAMVVRGYDERMARLFDDMQRDYGVRR